MKAFFTFLIILTTSLLNSAAPLNIVTTTTDLAWVAKQLGGANVSVRSLLNGTEDAHYLDAKPSFIRLVANADIVCFNGLALEIGWLPKVLSKSGNAKVQSGGKGHCNASKDVDVLEKVKGSIDRSMGDVHPEGNPHYSLSPLHLVQAAKSIRSILIRVDTANAELYLNRFKKLETALKQTHNKIKKRLAILHKTDSKMSVIQYHKEFSYFLTAYGFTLSGAIEPVPGVPPSAGRLAEVGLTAKSDGVKLALGANYAPRRLLDKFERISGIPHLQLPVSMPKKLDSYHEFQDFLSKQILATLNVKRRTQ